MPEHPAVAFLQWAHQQAESAAQGYGTSAQIDQVMVYGPKGLLQRVTAERELLAEHKSGIPGFERDDGDCCTCNVPEGGWTYGVPAGWPCRTVLLLAKSWGWEEEGNG